MAYTIGNYTQDAPSHRGWFVGTFIEEGAAKTSDVEIKYWEFPVGPTTHDTKESAIFECTLILTGKTRANIDGDEVILSAGDYIAIEPGTPNNTVVEILESVTGLTIKAPSDPAQKRSSRCSNTKKPNYSTSSTTATKSSIRFIAEI